MSGKLQQIYEGEGSKNYVKEVETNSRVRRFNKLNRELKYSVYPQSLKLQVLNSKYLAQKKSVRFSPSFMNIKINIS